MTVLLVKNLQFDADLQMDDWTTWCHVDNSFGEAKSSEFAVAS